MTDTATGLAIDAALEAKLARFLVLKDLASEYEKLKEELKPVFEGTEAIGIGPYKVTGKYVAYPEKKIPAGRYWDMRVKRKELYALTIGSQTDGGDSE
jgi:hypothetical protein